LRSASASGSTGVSGPGACSGGFVAHARGFHEQEFPLAFDGAFGGRLEMLQLKEPPANESNFWKAASPRHFAGNGVDDPAVFNVNPSGQLRLWIRG